MTKGWHGKVIKSFYKMKLFNYLLYKAEKLSLRPHFLVEWISAIGAQIDVKLARNEAPVFWADEVYF